MQRVGSAAMKQPRIYLTVGLLCLVGSVLCAFFALPGVPETLEAVPPLLQLGDLRQGQEVIGEFQLVNRFRHPLEIHKISESCGCSAVELDSKVLHSGQQTKLKAIWRTGSSRGVRQVHIWLTYRVADEPLRTVELTMQGKVIPDCEYEPGELAFQEGVAEKKTIQVRPGLWPNPVIEQAYASHRAFQVDVIGEREVHVAFDPAKWEYLGDLMPYLAMHTNCPHERILHIYIKVNKGTSEGGRFQKHRNIEVD